MASKDFGALYKEFKENYNNFIVQMTRYYEAFRRALNDGLITDEEYNEARECFGKLGVIQDTN